MGRPATVDRLERIFAQQQRRVMTLLYGHWGCNHALSMDDLEARRREEQFGPSIRRRDDDVIVRSL